MYEELDVIIKNRFIDEVKDGYPLISKESLNSWEKVSKEGTILNLLDEKRRFIAKAYHGVQNKGMGWVLTKEKKQKINLEFFKEKINKAIKYREDFYKNKETTAFRVLNGEGDNLGGLTIDYFDGFYLLTWYSLGIYQFKDEIIEALKSEVSYKGIYQKRRFDTKGQYLESDNDFVFGEKAPEPLIIKENNENFAIYLDDGPMVGVFLDQREVRKTIRDKYAKDKTVLNTFSYTGAFSVFAARGGAKKTTSVDLANRSRAKTQEQFVINNIDIEKQEIIVQDVFDYFNFAVKKDFLFDMVVVDPPSFARSKKRTFSVAKDYVKLLKEIIQITNKDGIIVASTNCANFGMVTFRDFIAKAFKESHKKYKIEESFSLPKDFKVIDEFRESSYLKVVFIRKLS
ncbi:MAG: class I SAM-dependent rRNA methyltransferase [Halarcobacter sp.]